MWSSQIINSKEGYQKVKIKIFFNFVSQADPAECSKASTRSRPDRRATPATALRAPRVLSRARGGKARCPISLAPEDAMDYHG